MPGAVVRRHAIQNIVRVIPFVHDDAGSGSHITRHHDVQDHFNVVAARGAVESVQQHGRDWHGGQSCLFKVRNHVCGVEAVEFHQSDFLTGASQGHTRRVGSSKIVTDEQASGTRSCKRHGRSQRRRFQIHWLRHHKVVEPANRKHLDVGIDGWIAVRCEKASSGGMVP